MTKQFCVLVYFIFIEWSLCDRYNSTVFPLLLSHVDSPTLDLKEARASYPWLARLVPSSLSDKPTLCTLACVKPNVYITAARSLIGLTVGVCTVIHNEHHFIVKALVISDEKKRTKQYFDDVGFVVTSSDSTYTDTWPTVKVYSDTVRTDGGFQWLGNILQYKELPESYKILAFHENDMSSPTKLYHLDATVSVHICREIYTRVAELQDYAVPCALTYCNIQRYNHHIDDCHETIEKEGAIIFNEDHGFVFGVVTWGARNMPVGFAVTNSEAFYMNLDCAVVLSEGLEAGGLVRACDEVRWG